MSNKVTAEYKGRKIELPILQASVGTPAIDVTNLYKENDVFTYDPGFMSTASCESQITFIDGDKGILRYRGYDIDELAMHSDFTEVSYLLLNGELPNASQKAEFCTDIKKHSIIHEQLGFIYRGFPRKSHPMAMLVGSVAMLSAFFHDEFDTDTNDQSYYKAAVMAVSKIPTLAAMAYRYSMGYPFVQPNDEYGYTEDFLRMLFELPTRKYDNNPILARAMDRIFILHADHEQNASTSTVRLAGSSGANPFACLGAGIASLWGPAHGGANEAVVNMLQNIGSKKNIPEFVKKAKDKNDPFRLMGFGHRVYKNYDPRAKVLRETCKEVLEELNITNDPLLEIAMELEKIALNDEYFISKKLYPNVDFYSGIIYQAMGLPSELYTVLFAVARTSGWMAQMTEMMNDPAHKIGRPRQLYTGYVQRDFVPIDKRNN